MAKINEFYKTDINHNRGFIRVNGDLETISGLENVKNALFRRLVTEKGSIVHRANFGVGIKSFQNAPGTLENRRLIAKKIEENFKYDPRVLEVTGVRMVWDDLTPEKTEIYVSVTLVGYGETDMKFIPFGG